jgi:hypothetical protein
MPESEMTPPDMPPPRRSPFEWSLASLRPVDSDAARQSFMYKAGQASRDGSVRFWRVIAVGCLVGLVGCGTLTFWTMRDAQERVAVAVAEAKASAARLGNGDRAAGVLPPPARNAAEGATDWNLERSEGVGPGHPFPSETPIPLAPLATARGDTPTPRDIAAALQLRRDILTAGLGLIPDGKPGPFQSVPESTEPSGWPTPGTVYATPPVTPKKPVVPADVEDRE